MPPSRWANAEWVWSDNSAWGFTNWETGGGDIDHMDRVLNMKSTGEWSDDVPHYVQQNCLCQGEIAVNQENGLTRFEVKRNQLKFLPFYVILRSKAISKQTKNSSSEEIRMSGFTLNWFLEDSNGSQLTEKLPARREDWKQKNPTPKYEQPLFAYMVQLARQLRLQNMTKEEILEEVILEKVKNVHMYDMEEMCSMGQWVEPQNLTEAFSQLTLAEELPSEEDIKTGYELYHVVVYCPATMVIKLFKFMDQFLPMKVQKPSSRPL